MDHFPVVFRGCEKTVELTILIPLAAERAAKLREEIRRLRGEGQSYWLIGQRSGSPRECYRLDKIEGVQQSIHCRTTSKRETCPCPIAGF